MAPITNAIKPKMAKTTVTSAKTAKIAKKKSKTEAAAKSDASGEGVAEHSGMIGDPDDVPLFKTFATDEALSGGLCLLRKVGDNKYEIVSLDTMTHDLISSERIALELKNVPERGTLLHQADGQFAAAKENCHLAMRVALGDIFPIQKLPIEVRDKIFKLVLGPPRRVRKFVLPVDRRRNQDVGYPPTPPTRFAGFDMMLTCRQFHNEGMALFWRNDFRIFDTSLFKKWNCSFSLNVQNITFQWSGMVKDRIAFTAFGKCLQLKVLRIIFDASSVMYKGDLYVPNRNELYQDEDGTKSFSKTNGFDELMQIRGLRSVSLRKLRSTYAEYLPATVDRDVRKFEIFLLRTLTLLRETTVAKPRTRKAPARTRYYA